ncbi:MAG TPA: DNA-directed RNA polymerase subunit alpha, partial [Armatimonadetes bacterium]|nr:DNA-directed RNA polymerase subunit alpha [Armatimonadota bacterium]
LNIKELAIKITDVADTSQPQTAHLRVKGAGEVTGADIEMPTGYEIANPEQHIAELTSQRAKLDMEMTIEVGKGFSPADRIDRSRLDIGVIPVDAIYTPIKKVNFSVEPTRVGTISNYERLVLEVWTNGTIDPDQALVEAAHRLIEHFRLFLGLGIPRRFMAVLLGVEEAPAALAEALLERSLDTIGLSGRVVGVLARAGINTLGDLVNRTREELNGISGFGPQALEEVENALSQLGLKLKVAEEVPTEQEPVEVGSAEGSESE